MLNYLNHDYVLYGAPLSIIISSGYACREEIVFNFFLAPHIPVRW